MNLIRNSGFEEGNLDYWRINTVGTFEYNTTDPNRGVGCLKLTCSGAAVESFESKDYIEVEPYDVLISSMWLKSAATRSCKLYLIEYDEDLNEVDYVQLVSKNSSASYTQYTAEHVVSSETRYVVIRCAVTTGANGEVFYFDDVLVKRYTSALSAFGNVVLCDITGATASSSTGNDKKDLEGFSEYFADLRVTSASGSTPSLSVTVYEYSVFDGAVLIASFGASGVAISKRIALPLSVGRQVFVAYTISGGTPSFDFAVDFIGKR